MKGPGDELRLYLLFTAELCAGDPWQTLAAALAGGVDLVQWREKIPDEAALRRCLEICRAHQVPLIVNDHVDLARSTQAAGCHVGQHDLPPAQARARLAKDQWLGVSTHSHDELTYALEGGADHVGFGPMNPTTTKGYVEGQPPGALRSILDRSPVPVYAIGGITPHNLPRILAEGCHHIAVSSTILAAPDPQAAAEALARALRRR